MSDLARDTDQDLTDRLRQIRRDIHDLAMRELALEQEELMLTEEIARRHAAQAREHKDGR